MWQLFEDEDWEEYLALNMTQQATNGRGYTGYDDMDSHVRLKLNGNREKIAAFHFICTRLDQDYPWPPDGMGRYRNTPGAKEPCAVCGGMAWHYPMLSVKQLRMLAEQLNADASLPGHLKLKVRYEGLASVCRTKARAN